MIFFAAGVVILTLLVMIGRKPRGTLKVRILSALFSLVSAAGGIFIFAEGSWVAGLGLLAAAVYLGYPGQRASASAWRAPPPPPPPPSDGMSLTQARALLGVPDGATREEIEAAYRRLMMRVHPDHGGAPGLAAQLNAARDRLLK